LLNKINSNQFSEIENYLAQFVSENIEELKSLTDDYINKNLTPNGFLAEYEDAINNAVINESYLSSNY
jgi:hypothetical protein